MEKKKSHNPNGRGLKYTGQSKVITHRVPIDKEIDFRNKVQIILNTYEEEKAGVREVKLTALKLLRAAGDKKIKLCEFDLKIAKQIIKDNKKLFK